MNFDERLLIWDEKQNVYHINENLLKRIKYTINWYNIFNLYDLSNVIKEKYKEFNTLDNRYKLKCLWCGTDNRNHYYRNHYYRNCKPIKDRINKFCYTCYYCPKCLR